MARGTIGRVKQKNTSRAYRALKRAKLPTPLAKAGANRVGQATSLRPKKRRRRRRMKRY